jgi:hypothetical protein
MVNSLALFALLLLPQNAEAPPSPADAPVRSALRSGGYPWYDSANDTLKPVQPPWRSSWLTRLGDWIDSWKFGSSSGGGKLPRIDLGQILVYLAFFIALIILLIALYYAYRAYAPAAQGVSVGSKIGRAAHVGGLPAGLQIDLTDPLGEARRLRAAGDYAGATLCLFVHLLLALQDAHHIRLAPGKTGRQLVRSIADRWIRARVEPTLRLFEASYYGHLTPSEAAFDYAWVQAESLDERLRQGGTA